MSLVVATYNILADSYVRPEYYPLTPPAVLAPAGRRAALIERIARMEADVLCLQEVEEDVFRAIAARLAGYERRYARKSGGKPDGCATFWRGMALISERTIRYADPTGHVALVLELEREGRPLGIANTHLKWEPPDAPPEGRVALGQVRELLGTVDAGAAWIACGDLNATPESAILGEALARGLRDPAAGRDAFTCNANRRAKRLDHLLHTPALAVRLADLPAIDADTPLPSEVEPSDHLPVIGEVSWA